MLWISLFILLLAFFVLLHAISRVDERRQMEVSRSVRESLSTFPDGAASMGAKDQEEWRRRFDDEGVTDLTALSSRMGPAARIDPVDGGGIRIRVPGVSLFPTGSAILSAEGRRILTAMAKEVQSRGGRVQVAVHLARSATRGGEAALLLSARRAMAVAGVVDPAGRRADAWGWGDLSPAFPYGQGEGEKNDRVEVTMGTAGISDGNSRIRFQDFLFDVLRKGAS